VTFTEWFKQLRRDPRGALEPDLIIAIAGVALIVVGGLVGVAGVHSSSTPIGHDHGEPGLGTAIAIIGGGVIVIGLVMGIINGIVYLRARSKARSTPKQP
jgi:hypothetical protein